jgi:hypothetical protein
MRCAKPPHIVMPTYVLRIYFLEEQQFVGKEIFTFWRFGFQNTLLFLLYSLQNVHRNRRVYGHCCCRV